MSRFPFAIIFALLQAVLLRAGAEELERRITFRAEPVPVSLNLRRGGPFVEAVVNGQPARFVVRPELNFSMIDEASAKRLGLKTLEGYDSVVLAPSLSVGGAEIRNEPLLIENWKQDARKLDGVLGHSTLREFTVRLYYADDELTLLKPEALPPPTRVEGVMEMLLTEEDISLSGTKVSARRGGIMVRTTALDGVSVRLKLESIRQGRPTLPAPLVKEKFPGLSTKPGALIQPQIKLGNPALGGMEFQVTEAGSKDLPDDAGVLTGSVLIYLNVTLDYAGRRVRVSSGVAPNYTIPGAEFTMRPNDNGAWLVTAVKEKSPAQRAGLEKGDALVSVEGELCGNATVADLDGLLWSGRRAVFAKAAGAREIEVTWTAASEKPGDPLITGLLREWAFPEGRDSVEIPITFSRGEPLVDVKVNGQTLHCLLDTGCSTSLLTVAAAERAGLKRATTGGGQSVSGERVPGFTGVAETVELGGLMIRREPWSIAAIPAAPGEENEDGLLGMGTLRDFVMRIDWQAKKLTLWKRGKEPPLEGGFTLALRAEEWPGPASAAPAPQRYRPLGCRIMVPVGGHLFPCVMDTGSGMSLALPEALVKEKLPDVAATAGPLKENGVGLTGVVMARPVHLPEVTLGSETVKDVPATLTALKDGNIGMQILRHYTITLDADGNRLHFLPYGTLHKLVTGSTLGFTAVLRDQKVVVSSMIPGGPAEVAGIKVGDVVDSVNGKKVREKSEKGDEEKEKKDPAPPGTPVKVKVIRGGVEMEFTLVSVKK